MRFPLTPSRSSARGSALLAVMWVIALLVTLVFGTVALLTEDVEMSNTRRQMFRARALAEQGLAIGAHPQVKQDDPLLRYVIAEDEGYMVEIEGEDGRLNPNVLLQREDRATWMNITRAWGLNLQESQILIDSLLDWVDQDLFVRLSGAELKFYNRPGFPFNRPFRNVDEMMLVRGMDYVNRIYPNWRDWFSIHSTGIVDVNEVTAEVITALTNADPRFAAEMVARRLGRDGIKGTKDDLLYPDVSSALLVLNVRPANAQSTQSLLGVNSTIRRIKSTGVAGDFRRTVYAVVRGAPGTGGAAQVLELGEEISKNDTPLVPPRR
jgi:general secretion pathway protein K